MFLVFSIFVLFALYGFLIFFEDSIPTNHKKLIYWGTCVLLIFMAGTREIGIDPDSENYEQSFLNPYNDNAFDAVEFTYVYIALALNNITNDAHSLFLVYALLGVFLKFVAFKRYSDSWLLLALMYISFYFQLHETCQIRAGVLSACMLLAVPCVAEGQRWIAFLWLVAGCCFHLSGIALLPILFFGNKPLSHTWKIVLALSVPLSYAIAGFNLGLGFTSELPYIGNKIAFYSEIEERGKISFSSLDLFGPMHLLVVGVFYYLLFWADVITEKVRFFPIMIKILALALFFYALFSFIPVLGERIGSLYRTITVVLFPALVYTLKPKWCGFALFLFVAFIMLNFSLKNMYGVTFILSPVK